MGNLEIILIGIGLAMDAFAVSICKGFAIRKINVKKMVKIALYFGIFQMLMPLVGYFLGNSFQHIIYKIDHWIAFILLLGIGLNMIKESFSKEEEDDSLDVKTMIVLSIATSIDALAIGITFGCLNVNIFLAVCLIGIITFIICLTGVKIGNKFGNKFKNKTEIIGGIILIFIGIKILLEHIM